MKSNINTIYNGMKLLNVFNILVRLVKHLRKLDLFIFKGNYRPFEVLHEYIFYYT